MVELRAQGLGFGRIAKAIGCARITVSRYLRSFEEEGRWPLPSRGDARPAAGPSEPRDFPDAVQ